jgi:hypothetical protein
MAHEWFYSRDGSNSGPISTNQIRSLAQAGDLLSTDSVRRDDKTKWVSASAIKGLFPVLQKGPPPLPKKLAGQSTVPESPFASETNEPRRARPRPGRAEKIRSSSNHQLIVIVASVLGGVVLLCGGFGFLAVIGQRASTTHREADHQQSSGDANGNSSVNSTSKSGYMDLNGKVVIDFQFDSADEFSEGLAAVNSQGKWGFIDRNGKYVIKPQYQHASSFHEGMAGVEIDGKHLCINKSGQVVFEIPYSMGKFSGGVALCFERAPTVKMPYQLHYGLIDNKGNVIVAPRFTSMSDFADGRAVVDLDEDHDLSGIIDNTGKVVVEPTRGIHFGNTASGVNFGFSEGLVAYVDWSVGLAGYVDINGNRILPASKVRCEPVLPARFSDGLAKIQMGMGTEALNGKAPVPSDYMKVAYIDKSGTIVVPPRFADGRDFSGGLIAVQPTRDGKWGYIDRTGKFVIEPQFDLAEDFAEGRAKVRIGEPAGLIDSRGQFIVKPYYKNIGRFSGGLAYVEMN